MCVHFSRMSSSSSPSSFISFAAVIRCHCNVFIYSYYVRQFAKIGNDSISVGQNSVRLSGWYSHVRVGICIYDLWFMKWNIESRWRNSISIFLISFNAWLHKSPKFWLSAANATIHWDWAIANCLNMPAKFAGIKMIELGCWIDQYSYAVKLFMQPPNNSTTKNAIWKDHYARIVVNVLLKKRTMPEESYGRCRRWRL